MRNQTILVVEDNSDDFLFLKRAFSRVGIDDTLQWTKDGIEALSWLKESSSDGGLPILIISDLKMPGMDGIRLVERLKSEQNYRFIPFVMLSSSTLEKDIRRGYENGIDHFLVKPTDSQDLIQIVTAIKEGIATAQFNFSSLPYYRPH